jgi:hypothetical protein
VTDQCAPISPEEFDHLVAEMFSNAARAPVRRLGPDTAPTAVEPRAQIKLRHHRVAQLLATGMSDTDAGRLVGYTSKTVATLRADPTFAELVTHYVNQLNEATVASFTDFVQSAHDLSIEAMNLLRDKLEEKPDSFSPSLLLEVIKVTADRSGNGAQTKSTQVNINVGIGERMRSAKQRLAAQQDLEMRNITPAHSDA